MKYLNFKKNKTIKSTISGIIIGSLVTCGIGVTAITLNADQIKYTPNDNEFKVSNAKEALDEIYKISEYKIPANTYFYNSNTNGEEIVRYKKENNKYYLCNEYGKITNNKEQDVTNLNLTEYSSITSTNVKTGNAGFVDGNLILGNKEDAKTRIINILTVNNNGSNTVTQNLKNVISNQKIDYTKLTNNNFILSVKSVVGNTMSRGSYKSAYIYPSFSYNNTTGDIVITGLLTDNTGSTSTATEGVKTTATSFTVYLIP